MNVNESRPLPARTCETTVHERERVTMTGVNSVDSFDENEVCARTEASSVTILGTGLRVSRLDPDSGLLTVDGFIRGIEYSDAGKKDGLFSRLFR